MILCGALAATIEMDGYPHGMSDFVFLQRMYDAGAKGLFRHHGRAGLWTVVRSDRPQDAPTCTELLSASIHS